MKRLLVLWDPENPISPVAPVLSALREEVEIVDCSFRDVAHRTLPNRTFEIVPYLEKARCDSLLWVEGGPLPKDLGSIDRPKACWLTNAHLEPSLLEEVGGDFDLRLVSSLELCAAEEGRWLPLSAFAGTASRPPDGVSFLSADPKPPAHAVLEHALRRAGPGLPRPPRPIVICPGLGSQVHPLLLECLRMGGVVVTESGTDLRGLALPREHVEVLPDLEGAGSFIRELATDEKRLAHLSERGREVVEHLHTPALRARQLADALWPKASVWGRSQDRPRVSVLVTCHRYLKRFRFCLESLARQAMPPGTVEIVVADPESPDGLARHLEEFAGRNEHLRVVRLPLDVRYHRNRGVGINRAFDLSRGDVIVSIDGDLVFAPDTLARLVAEVEKDPAGVYGIRRAFLSKEVTEGILAGRADPFQSFEELSRSTGDGEEMPFVGVLGYCQAVSRAAFAKVRYPEEFDMVNQSDIVYVERLARFAGVQPRFLGDLTALHLWHPRNWKGTTQFL